MFTNAAQAATKMLKDGGDLRNGRTLMQKYVFNNMYTSKQGFQVKFTVKGTKRSKYIFYLFRFWLTKMEMLKEIFQYFPCSIWTRQPWQCNKWDLFSPFRMMNCLNFNWVIQRTFSGWMDELQKMNLSAGLKDAPMIGASSSRVYSFFSSLRSLALFSLSMAKDLPNLLFRAFNGLFEYLKTLSLRTKTPIDYVEGWLAWGNIFGFRI